MNSEGQSICKLKFFQRLLWLDPNMSIKKELGYLTWFFGRYLDFSFCIEDTQKFSLEDNTKILVMCSSRLIKQTYEAFLHDSKFFPKMIVFCGNASRAKEIMQTSPYKEAIYQAHYQQAALVQAITTLDEKMLRDPGMMNLRIQVRGEKFEQQQKHPQLNKKIENKKKPKEKKTNNEKKEIKKKQVKKQAKKEQNIPQFKLKPGNVIYLAVKDEKQAQQMKNKIINPLNKQGIQVFIQNFDEIRYTLNQLEKKCILISKYSNDIEDLKSFINDLESVIRITQSQKEQSYGEGQILVKSASEIIERLRNIQWID